MKTYSYRTMELGQVIACAFDEAARHSNDPKEVSRLATHALEHVFLSARVRRGAFDPVWSAAPRR